MAPSCRAALRMRIKTRNSSYRVCEYKPAVLLVIANLTAGLSMRGECMYICISNKSLTTFITTVISALQIRKDNLLFSYEEREKQ